MSTCAFILLRLSLIPMVYVLYLLGQALENAGLPAILSNGVPIAIMVVAFYAVFVRPSFTRQSSTGAHYYCPACQVVLDDSACRAALSTPDVPFYCSRCGALLKAPR